MYLHLYETKYFNVSQHYNNNNNLFLHPLLEFTFVFMQSIICLIKRYIKEE